MGQLTNRSDSISTCMLGNDTRALLMTKATKRRGSAMDPPSEFAQNREWKDGCQGIRGIAWGREQRTTLEASMDPDKRGQIAHFFNRSTHERDMLSPGPRRFGIAGSACVANDIGQVVALSLKHSRPKDGLSHFGAFERILSPRHITTSWARLNFDNSS
ncbi:hypothetical protein OBBRIDRAFT_807544 [Obba rivulosa]|uniref:Uncharacterized protein n=1 Tax=Obba rivulosa TaxID=1052685 RepID=A0A8E2DEZ5_9APHY|nr:hypothetical protein OBBRIDRAFT_807544 [Obba rivulosa]